MIRIAKLGAAAFAAAALTTALAPVLPAAWAQEKAKAPAPDDPEAFVVKADITQGQSKVGTKPPPQPGTAPPGVSWGRAAANGTVKFELSRVRKEGKPDAWSLTGGAMTLGGKPYRLRPALLNIGMVETFKPDPNDLVFEIWEDVPTTKDGPRPRPSPVGHGVIRLNMLREGRGVGAELQLGLVSANETITVIPIDGLPEAVNGPDIQPLPRIAVPPKRQPQPEDDPSAPPRLGPGGAVPTPIPDAPPFDPGVGPPVPPGGDVPPVTPVPDR